MEIIPAIDLYEGQCVRLAQGSFDKVTAYASNPITMAKTFMEQGASQLHVVDLSGAKSGKPKQLEAILAIKQSCDLCLQVGGGLRDEHSIAALLNQGIDRVVIGSLAVNSPAEVLALIENFGMEKFVLALDVKINQEPMVATHGWQSVSALSLWTVLEKYAEFSGLQILCTDVARDGMLQGPNLSLYRECVSHFPQLCFQASGGIGQLQDLIPLKNTGVRAVIVGKALYEQRFSLSQAFSEVGQC